MAVRPSATRNDSYGSGHSVVSADNGYRYTGRENDGRGLYYYRARYYAPERAQIVSEYRAQLWGGLNSYAYVDGNPLSFVDPLGLEAIGSWTFAPGPQRDEYDALKKSYLKFDFAAFADFVEQNRFDPVAVAGT
ncbi:RHS repeat-associated core domain-containing protein [Luteibacter sp. Sphag1AF]|uniref:RHS repeat-associated core domain-containing protein n=1 Tax=Luteibacter sp. Sphag1AF TaxID=2587031 RepID=UPI001C8587BE